MEKWKKMNRKCVLCGMLKMGEAMPVKGQDEDL